MWKQAKRFARTVAGGDGWHPEAFGKGFLTSEWLLLFKRLTSLGHFRPRRLRYLPESRVQREGRLRCPPGIKESIYFALPVAASLCKVELESSKVSTLGVPSTTFASAFSTSW